MMKKVFVQRVVIAAGLVVASIGCTPRPPTFVPDDTSGDERQSAPLRVIVIDDEQLADVIGREWRANMQQEAKVRKVTRAEFATEMAQQADVLIFPTNWLGELADAEVIRPMTFMRPQPEESIEDYAWEDVFPLIRREEARWGDKIYGVSFGSPQLILVYRQDLFDRWNLRPPATWGEYQQLLETLTKRVEHAQSEQPRRDFSVSLEPLSSGWAARTLLARSAAYSRERSQYSALFHFVSMEPLINRPPFVRGLEELRQSAPHRADASIQMSPADVMQHLLDGKAAIGITWPSAAIRPSTESSEAPLLSFAALPGSADVFHLSSSTWQKRPSDEDRHVPLLGVDGRMGSVTRRARSVATATSFLCWLTGREQGTRIASRSLHTTLFRESQIPSSAQWVSAEVRSISGQYADVLLRTQTRPKWLTLLRLPGHERYLHSLDHAVRGALQSDEPSQTVLDRVAHEWSQITHELGVDQQRAAYQQSLGLDLD